MILDGENRVLPMPHPFHSPVIEVEVGDLKCFRTGHSAGVALDCESMILGCDKYLSRMHIPHWVIPAAMAVRELHRLSTERQSEQLMTETNSENRQLTIGEVADGVDGVADRRGITRPIREKEAVRFELAHARRGGRCGHHRHPAV